MDCKTYAKPSAFVKYVIKFVGTANPITNFEFADEYEDSFPSAVAKYEKLRFKIT